MLFAEACCLECLVEAMVFRELKDTLQSNDLAEYLVLASSEWDEETY